MGSASSTYTRPLEEFRQGLRELGWNEGRNLLIEYRFAEGHVDRLPVLADELAKLKVLVIVASPTPSALAARNVTRTIPIVGMGLTEPVAVGLVASLARPGGNVTGLTYGVDTAIFGKQLQLLKEVVPNLRQVAVLMSPGSSPAQPLVIEAVKIAARSLDLPLLILEAREPSDFDGAFAAMVKERAGALFLMGDPVFFVHRAQLAGLAMKNGLPSCPRNGSGQTPGVSCRTVRACLISGGAPRPTSTRS
jgi:putative ABC transport system substrate-binding protein